MTATTLVAAPYNDANAHDTAAREAGIAAALADREAGTPLDVIATRVRWLIDLGDMPYALGYAGQWVALGLSAEYAIEAERTLAPLQRDHQLQVQVRTEIAAMEESEMSRTARRTRTAQPKPATLTLVKPTVSLLKPPLRMRHVNRLTREYTEARAALDATSLGLNRVIPVATWTSISSRTATALLEDDTSVVFTAGSDGRRGTFFAYTMNPGGDLVETAIRTADDLQIARHRARTLRDKAAIDPLQTGTDWAASLLDTVPLQTVQHIAKVTALGDAAAADIGPVPSSTDQP